METEVALHDPDLIKAYDRNRRAIALTFVPETAVRNMEAMPVHERRYRFDMAEAEARRNDLLANRPGHPDAAEFRRVADCARKTAAALKAIGL